MNIHILSLSAFALLGLSGLLCQVQHAAPQPTMNELPRYSKSGYDLTPLSKEKVAEIVKTLPPIAVDVTQKCGTERPFTGAYNDNHKAGIYVGVVGGLPLFRSSAKFDSGTGWPSFFQPFDPDHIILKKDTTAGMT